MDQIQKEYPDLILSQRYRTMVEFITKDKQKSYKFFLINKPYTLRGLKFQYIMTDVDSSEKFLEEMKPYTMYVFLTCTKQYEIHMKEAPFDVSIFNFLKEENCNANECSN